MTLKIIRPQADKMILPQEIEVWYMLPAIRKELALSLLRHGLNQKETAKMLGVTEAAVSQYKSEKRAHGLEFDERIKSEIQKAAERVLVKPTTIFAEIMGINSLAKREGVFCEIHRAKSATPAGCETVCRQHFSKEIKERI